MKSKNIFILLLILLIVYIGYSFYRNSKPISMNTANIKSAVSLHNTANKTQAVTKNEIGKIIKKELNENPEIIINALESHVNKQQNAHNVKLQQKVLDYKKQLINNNGDPKFGNVNAKNVFITFYDYNCGYCKKMSEVIKKMIDNKSDMYIVFKELPILGNDSIKASKIALAVSNIAPSKFIDFHFALMEDYSNKPLEHKVKNICKSLNIDINILYKQADDTTVQSTIDQNFEIARVIGFRSTPTVIINDHLVPGFIDYDHFLRIISLNNHILPKDQLGVNANNIDPKIDSDRSNNDASLNISNDAASNNA